MSSLNKSFKSSVTIHVLGLALLLAFIHFKKPPLEITESKIDISIFETAVTSPPNQDHTISKSSQAIAKTSARIFAKTYKSQSAIDLRPGFMKRPIYATESVREDNNDRPESEALALLTIEPRIANAFEHLAFTINRQLEYPDLLFQHGVQGFAVLDLKFDQAGNVDEEASTFKGSHYALRGLLSHAARIAIVEWYRSDAYRLRKNEFRGQHFHVEFEISYTEENKSSLLKSGADSYQMIRRKKKFECAHLNGLDVACLAVKTTGMISNILSDTSNMNFRMLMDKISEYDDAGIRGINGLIHGS